MAYSLASIDRLLSNSINTSSGCGEYFTHPIRSQFKIGNVAKNWQPLSAPSGEVWHKNISTKMQFRLKENPPSTRTTTSTRTARKRPGILMYCPSGERMCRCRARGGN